MAIFSGSGLGNIGNVVTNVAQMNIELLDVARSLGNIAAKIQDPALRGELAREINRILDMTEKSDRAVRTVVPAA